MEIQKFERSGISFRDNDVFATRKQIELLYEVPRKTLADNINKLKEDGLITGAKIRHTANDDKQYNTEVYNLDEIIAIGLRLRSDRAIKFQRWAISVLRQTIEETNKQLRMQQAQLDFFWDKQDQKDLYGG